MNNKYWAVLTEIPVGGGQINKAKKMQEEFNKIKISNKFTNRPTDFHGALGELVFDFWLKLEGIPYEWVPFVTNIPNDPDFTFQEGDITLDVKTTRFDRLYWQKPVWDYYVLLQPAYFKMEMGKPDFTKPQKMIIKGWLSKQDLIDIQKEVDAGNTSRGNTETKFGKKSYFAYPKTLRHIGELLDILR